MRLGTLSLGKLRIAQVAPLSESVPPKLYGGTERVVSVLTDELVRQGHAVTLFASGDSRTSATLVAPCAQAQRLIGCSDPLVGTRADDRAGRPARQGVRHHPLSRGARALSAGASHGDGARDHLARSARPAGSGAALRGVQRIAARVDLRRAAHAAATPELGGDGPSRISGAGLHVPS